MFQYDVDLLRLPRKFSNHRMFADAANDAVEYCEECSHVKRHAMRTSSSLWLLLMFLLLLVHQAVALPLYVQVSSFTYGPVQDDSWEHAVFRMPTT